MFKKFLTLILIVTIGSALLAQTPKPQTTQYTCVMHPEVVQGHPGKCPKCAMELGRVKKSNAKQSAKEGADDATADEPMHHRHIEEGRAMQVMKRQQPVSICDCV